MMRTFHPWELFGCIYVERRAIDAFAMSDIRTEYFIKTQFQPIRAFCTDGEIWKDKEASVCVGMWRRMRVFEVVKG
jgi:hypothetical protein